MKQNVIRHRGVHVPDALRDALRMSWNKREIYAHPIMHYVARPAKTMGCRKDVTR